MAEKAKIEKVMTPKFRGAFVNIFRAKEPKGGGEAQFGICALFPKDLDLSKLEKAADRAGIAKWGKEAYLKHKKSQKFGWPFMDGDVEREDYDGFEDKIYLNIRTKIKPGIVDKDREAIIDESEAYSGAYYRATVVFYAYHNEEFNKRGIGCSLQNVQKLADGETFSSRTKAEDDFEEWDEDDDFDGDDDL